MTQTDTRALKASFRDPSGFIFTRDGVLYRQVNQVYREDYDRLMQSGLYDRLVKSHKLIPHSEVEVSTPQPELAYRIIQPERVPFISYPYEWSFSQLQDAALLTLSAQKTALDCGMSLKDSSAYNVQFYQGRPILIDTLSFETYREGSPWVAYRQFCQHFLAPLALMAFRDVRLGQMLRLYIDGIPLDLASRLLPFSTRLRWGLLAHIHLHAAAQQQFSDRGDQAKQRAQARTMNKATLLELVESLKKTVKSLSWKPKGTEWGDYYDSTNYTRAAFDEKQRIVQEFLRQAQPATVWDLGANTGVFSRLAAQAGAFTVAFDVDPAAVEKNYRLSRESREANLLPLVLDLTNPSPAIGWGHEERESLVARGPADLAMALALVHHLAISNNVPLPLLAEFFSRTSHWLVIEFVPKEDSQVQRLLASREDIFDHYTQADFERSFAEWFTFRAVKKIEGSQRSLYLMENSTR